MGKDRQTRVTSVNKLFTGGELGTVCLVEVYGANLGRKYDLLSEVVTLGRDPENAIVLESDSVSRRHARIEKVNEDWYIVDLGSTNGTYVNDKLIQPRARLVSGQFIKIGELIFKYLNGDNIESAYHEEIYRTAVTDGLTQVANKRALADFLEREVARSGRHNRTLTVLMMDLDHFKLINDTHGHLTGDVVLKEVAAVVKARIRKDELFARYGGEEFVCVLPETDLAAAKTLAEEIRESIQQHIIVFEGQELNVTVSIGAVEFDARRHQTTADLLMEADRNLYVAKNNGRNCVHG
ncbi:MAG TPA: GGDEF domain-containing protein [Myxococcota bacterium]|nr:GGDEF domain-containing protein [Myxococcota bacterium]HQP95501.1 GGDEF domain-containing protein [Myxococcota bacterium]